MRVTTASQMKTQMELMSAQYDRVQQLQIEASTGKKLQKPSEAPVLAERAQYVQDNINKIEAYQSNVVTAQARTNLLNTTIGACVDAVTQVQQIMIAAQNDTHNNADRTAMASALSDIQSLLFNLSGTSDANGEFIFSGMNVTMPPYTIPSGVYVYQGAQTPVDLSITDTNTVVYGQPGNLVFGEISTGIAQITVFDVIASTMTLLNTPVTTDPQRAAFHSAMNTQMSYMAQALSNMLNVQVSLGAQGDTLVNQASIYEQQLLDQTVYLGTLQDADIASVLSELSQRLTNLEVTEQSYVKIQDTIKRILV